MSFKFEPYLKDFRWWIVLFFFVRLLGITNPPLDTEHSWRQSTVAMVARNFQEVDSNIFYPRMDIYGGESGVTGMEFPLLNYGHYLMAEMFGYQHWYGRLINLIISSFGLLFFYLLIVRYFNKETAFKAGMILLFSLWFSYSRKIMPDTFSASFILMSIYFGSNFFENERRKVLNLSFYTLFFLCGALSKLPSAFLMIIVGFFVINPQYNLRDKVSVILVSIAALIPISYWYFYWIPHLNSLSEFQHFYMGTDLMQGAMELWNEFPQTIKKFYDTSLKFVGFAAFVFGLYAMIKEKNRLLTSVLLSCSLLFLLVMLKAGFAFPHHSYYVIPFVPVMALVAGYGLDNLTSKKWAYLLLMMISVEGILNQHHDFRIHPNESKLTNLEHDLNSVSQKDDLVLINSGDYPTPMYMAHRRGWVRSNDYILNKENRLELLKSGMKFIVVLKKSFGRNLDLPQEIVLENDDYKIYKCDVLE